MLALATGGLVCQGRDWDHEVYSLNTNMESEAEDVVLKKSLSRRFVKGLLKLRLKIKIGFKRSIHQRLWPYHCPETKSHHWKYFKATHDNVLCWTFISWAAQIPILVKVLPLYYVQILVLKDIFGASDHIFPERFSPQPVELACLQSRSVFKHTGPVSPEEDHPELTP